MAKIEFTPSQQAAIDARGETVLVSAAAGSGKTAVLTQRVTELLTGENPIPADRLIIVTFTVLASIEMRQRIEQKLNDLIETDPENELYQTQHLLLSRAKIGTIDSLCGEILRDHFQEVGLPVTYRIAEDNELRTLQQDLLESMLEECYQEGTPEFLTLADFLSERDDRRLGEMILEIYRWIRSYPFPLSVLDRFEEMYRSDAPLKETKWFALYRDHVGMLLEQVLDLFVQAKELASADEKLLEKYVPALEEDSHAFQMMKRALEEDDWDRVCSIYRSHQKQSFKAVRGCEDPELQQRVKDLREYAYGLLKKSSWEPSYFLIDEQGFQEDQAFLREKIAALFGLVRRYAVAVRQEMLSRGLLDFPDLEHYTLELLIREEDGYYRKTPAALSLSALYDEIMIDECQDINTIQNLIFWALSRGEEKVRIGTDEMLTKSQNLFLVGDVKQSIYRFRNAMPTLFTRRKKLFSMEEHTGPGRKILLQNNFRSREEVTDSVNQLFFRVMTEELGELTYNEEEELVPSAPYEEAPGRATELHLVETGNREDDGGKDPAIAVEAEYIAHQIRLMVESGYMVQNHGEMRRCTWRDFCILMRSKKGKVAPLADKLKELGIPCYAEAGQGYFDSFEISVMLSLLRVIDNPMLDIDLFTVMLSPMFLFTPDDLARIRLKDRKAPLYTAVGLCAQEGDPACREFLETLSFLRTQAVILPVSRLVQLIYDRTGFLFVVESMVSGEQKRANLRLLLSYAENYESIGKFGLDGFLRFIGRAIERGDDFICANTVSERADVVRIMSIHGSKGLEFPICILADLGKAFNTMDLKKRWMLHPDYGFGMEIQNQDTCQRYSTMPIDAIRIANQRELLSEEMRVLYVAMTRAKEKLVLIGSGKNIRGHCERLLKTASYGRGVSPFLLSRQRSFLDWILLSLSGSVELGKAVTGETDTAVAGAFRCIFSDIESAQAEEAGELVFHCQPSEKLLRQLTRAIEFEYPDQALQAVPAKVTVTQIAKSKQQEALAQLEEMRLATDDVLSGAQRGTILHSFMQYADFTAAKQDLGKEIERLSDAGFLKEEDAQYLNRRTIRSFLDSKLLARMMAAQYWEREYQFIYEISAREVDDTLPEQYAGEQILMQGIADAVFIENGELVIVDYKTDRLSNPAEFAAKYADQLRIYKAALEQYFQLPVKECLIYSLHLAKEIKVC